MFSVRKQRYTDAVTGGEIIGVVTIVREIEVGRPLLPDDLALVSRPGQYVEQRHVTDLDVMRVIGVPTENPLRRGQVLTWDDLRIENRNEETAPSLTIPPGLRAVSVNTEARSINDLLSAGDHVDVFFSIQGDEDRLDQTVLLVQNVAVMADDVVRVSSNGNYYWQRCVTFATNTSQALLLKHAAKTGTLDFAVRHPEDDLITDEEMVATASDLVEPAEREARSRRRRPRPTRMSITRIE